MGQRQLSNIEIGPYEPGEAEWLTEHTLDSKEAYISFEQLYRGDISANQFMCSIQFLSESLHSDYQDEQRGLERESFYDQPE